MLCGEISMTAALPFESSHPIS